MGTQKNRLNETLRHLLEQPQWPIIYVLSQNKKNNREVRQIICMSFFHQVVNVHFYSPKITVNCIHLLNTFKPNGIFHSYQLDQSISILRDVWWYFPIEHSVSKQWRPWIDAALCGVWSGPALFAYVQQKKHDRFKSATSNEKKNYLWFLSASSTIW